MKKMLMVAMLLSAPFVSQANWMTDWMTVRTEQSTLQEVYYQKDKAKILYRSAYGMIKGILREASQKFGKDSDKFDKVLEKVDEFLEDNKNNPMTEKQQWKELDSINHWYVKVPKK